MESLVDQGLVRSIGVSNFSPEKIQKLMDTARIRPAVNQVRGYVVPGEGVCGTRWGGVVPSNAVRTHAAALRKHMHTYTDLLIVHDGGARQLYDCLRLPNEKEMKRYGNAFLVVKLEMKLLGRVTTLHK